MNVQAKLPLSVRYAQAATTCHCIARIAACFALVFLAVLYLYPKWECRQANEWVATQCLITNCQIYTHHGKSGIYYTLAVDYTYEVAGQIYRGNRYNFDVLESVFYSENWRLDTEQRFQPGTKVTCYVNPANLTDVVLVRNFDSFDGLALAVLLFLGAILFSSLALYAKWRSSTKSHVRP